MRIISHFESKLKWGLGLVVLIGLLMTPGMVMAGEKDVIGTGVVQGDPGDALGLRVIIFQEDPRDGLNEPQKFFCGEPEDGLDFFPWDADDDLDLCGFQENWSILFWPKVLRCISGVVGPRSNTQTIK